MTRQEFERQCKREVNGFYIENFYLNVGKRKASIFSDATDIVTTIPMVDLWDYVICGKPISEWVADMSELPLASEDVD